MDSPQPFALFDCSLARSATGTTCTNLRELLETIRRASDSTIEHHMMRCALDYHFQLYEFPNDLAHWCWEGLGDDVLGEQLALVNPYQCKSIPDLRAALLNVVEERVWGLERVPQSRPGRELRLLESHIVAFDTGERFATPASLAEAIPHLTLRSLFFHVHEARRRTQNRTDDFSDWLQKYGADASLVTKLRSIDFYFLNLNEVRHEFIAAFRQHASEPRAAGAGAGHGARR